MSLVAERVCSNGAASCSSSSHVSNSCRMARRLSATRRKARIVVAYSDRPDRNGGLLNGIVVTEPAVPSSSPSSAPAIREGELVKTRYIAETLLPTRHGKFRLRGYKHSLDGGVTFTEPTAIICGQVEGKSDVPVRVHDACFTSEVLGSLKCDCAEQLSLALEYIQQQGCGMVIYLQQEGRGIGLANKIAAYALQEQGLDTVDANRALGLPDDCREYTSVRNILKDLAVRSVKLMTNNPRKLDVLTQLGVAISGRIPCQVQAGEYNQGYLEAKRDRMHHMLAPGGTITHQHSSSSSSKSNSKGNVNASSNNIIMYSPHVAAESVPVRRAAPGGAVSQQPSPVPVKNASLVLHHNLQGYLAAKRQRMDHLLDGSWCYWNHDGEPTQPSAVAHSEGGMGLPAGMQAAKANSTSPALASHTVQMDEDEDDGSSSSSNEQVLLVNGSAASSIRLSRKSSSSGSSTAGGGSA